MTYALCLWNTDAGNYFGQDSSVLRTNNGLGFPNNGSLANAPTSPEFTTGYQYSFYAQICP